MTKNNINRALEEEASPQEYTITKSLKLETVNEGSNEDDVLVRGNDNTVKYVPQSSLGGGGSQTLQQILEAGNIAEFDGGNSRVKLLKGDPNSRTIELATSDGIIRSSMVLGNTYASLSHSEPAPGRVHSNISASNEGIDLSNNDNGTNGWSNAFKVPNNTSSQTTYTLPIDRPNGNYTLATVDQVKGGSQNLQQTLDNGNVSTQSIIIGIEGSDGIEGAINSTIESDNINVRNNESGFQTYMDTYEFSVHKKTIDNQENLRVQNDRLSYDENGGGRSNNLILKREGEGVATYKLNDTKPNGYEGILATTDETTFKSVFERGNTTEAVLASPNGNNEIAITLVANDENQSFILSGSHKNETISPIASGIDIENGEFHIHKIDLSTFDRTTIQIDNPIASNVRLHFPAKSAEGDYTLATLDDITSNSPVSDTKTGIVDNTPLQELGGVDKLINGIRIGKGGGNLTTNVVLGDYALLSNSTGNNSTAIGYESMYSNTTGTYNTSIGSYSLYYNTTGLVNTSIGAYASTSNITGSYNTVVGCNALNANQFGSANVAIGASALKSNVGVSGSNIYGHRSIAIGSNSMYNNTTGNGIAIGDTSLRSQTTGAYNIAIGLQAGSGITTGNANVIVADTGFIAAGGGITTGSNNMIIAPNNGNTTGITTGSGNVVLGKVTGLSASASNTITISDGVGNIAITKSTTGELKTPNLTQALILSGGTTSLVTKGYVDNAGAVDNATTTILSSTTLTSTYPNALSGFRVRCLNIASGALTYEKTTVGWIQYAIAITQ